MNYESPRVYLSLSNIASAAVAAWCLAFVMTRLHMFQHVYTRKLQEFTNDEWLRQQCESDDFYHNMKHHSSICEDANAKLNESIWLSAADHVARHSYLCGYSPCATLLEDLVAWMLGRGVVITSIFCGLLMVMPSIFLPLWRRNITYCNDVTDISRIETPRIKRLCKSEFI